MSVTIISIGGTGHRITKAIIHFLAMGVIDVNDDINLISIDSDINNGALDELSGLVKLYNEIPLCNKIFKNKISFPIQDSNNGSFNINLSLQQTNFSNIINKNSFSNLKSVIEFLYTEDELTTQLNGGFYGHPTIGTYIITNHLNKHEPWKKFNNELQETDKVLIIGSAFGGTGASGIPIVVQQLYNNTTDRKVRPKIGVMFVMPYFNVSPNNTVNNGLNPDGQTFLPKTKNILEIYHQQNFIHMVDNFYIIGEDMPFTSMSYNAEGFAQKNTPHPLELYAATALDHFIDNDGNHRVYCTAKSENSGNAIYDFQMFFKGDIKNTAIKLIVFTKLAILFNRVYYHEIIKKINKRHNYISDNYHVETKKTYEYFNSFINWLYYMSDNNNMNLFNFSKNGKYTDFGDYQNEVVQFDFDLLFKDRDLNRKNFNAIYDKFSRYNANNNDYFEFLDELYEIIYDKDMKFYNKEIRVRKDNE
jgi:hypothetical protein